MPKKFQRNPKECIHTFPFETAFKALRQSGSDQFSLGAGKRREALKTQIKPLDSLGLGGSLL